MNAVVVRVSEEVAMPFRFANPIRALSSASRIAAVRRVSFSLLLLGAVLTTASLQAQQSTTAVSTTDQQTIQMLLQRIDRLETRVAQLEAQRQTPLQPQVVKQEVATLTPPPDHITATPTIPAPPEHAGHGPAMPSPVAQQGADSEQHVEPEVANPEPERMDMSKTLLRMRGFGDVSFNGADQKGSTTSFSLGQLNLFVTSDISEKFKFLGEIVFESGPDNFYEVPSGRKNEFGVDVERYLLQYSYNDYFNLAVGRYHTAIGFYNTAYHHSTWFQTTTGRPLLFQFEDTGGILPIHNVGVSASGRIPSGSLGLHYVAEIGNGRASRSPLEDEPVQNEVDENNHKAFNLALFARPEAIHGLQFGFSGYHDLLTPLAQPPVGETILAAHGVYMVPNFEWLNEVVLVRHSPQDSSRVFNTTGFYTQISKRWGSYRPYFRYQYINAPNNEPIFPDVGLRAGPSVGLRYDAAESVALKFQYDYNQLRNQPGVNALTLQLGFTF
jgi:hypothetical protein